MPKIAAKLKVNPNMVKTAMHNDLAINHLLGCQKKDGKLEGHKEKKIWLNTFKNHGSLLEKVHSG